MSINNFARLLPFQTPQNDSETLNNYQSTTQDNIIAELKNRIKQLEEINKKQEVLLQNTSQSLTNEKSQLSIERQKLAAVLSGISDAIIAVNLNKEIISFNKAAEVLTGYLSYQVIGKPINRIIKLMYGDQEISDLVYCQTKIGGFEGIVFQQQNIKLQGLNKISTVNLTTSQIKDQISVNLGCILTIHDVTAESVLEELKLDFVSMAAHELRTPLTALRGYLSVFISENKSKFKGESAMFLERINLSAQQLSSLVENLLNVSKIERGSIDISLKKELWLPIVRQMIQDFTHLAKEKNIELVFLEPEDNIPFVKVDKLKIMEVLSNLLSNAINFTPKNGRVKVWVEVGDNEIITHVQDTGVGIPKQAIPHLFTKFYKVIGRLQQGSKGTGLGLYIAKSIVYLHHGRIWVESREGIGSTFSFAIPITP